MDKNIEPVNFDASKDLVNHIDQMFDDLTRYHDRIVSMDIYMKSHPEKDTETKVLEVRVFLPGKDIFISQGADDFVSASQQLYDKLKRKLRDYKERDKEKRHHG